MVNDGWLIVIDGDWWLMILDWCLVYAQWLLTHGGWWLADGNRNDVLVNNGQMMVNGWCFLMTLSCGWWWAIMALVIDRGIQLPGIQAANSRQDTFPKTHLVCHNLISTRGSFGSCWSDNASNPLNAQGTITEIPPWSSKNDSSFTAAMPVSGQWVH